MTTLIGRYAHYHTSGLPVYGRIIEHEIDEPVPYVIISTASGRVLAVADFLILDDNAAIESCLDYARMWQREANRIAAEGG